MNIKKAKKKALKEINGLFEAVDKLEGNKSENLKKEKHLFERRYHDAEFRIGVLETMLEETLLELRDCESELERSNLANIALKLAVNRTPRLRVVKPTARHI